MLKVKIYDIILVMKRFLLSIFLFLFVFVGASFADENYGLRDYDGIQIPTGTFIPVSNEQEISTAYNDIGNVVKFISVNDMYMYEQNILPRETEFFGYIEKLNEPVIGTNASLVIKITKLKLIDGFELPVRGYIYTTNNNLIGGEMTYPEKYDRKPVFKQGLKGMVGYVPGETRRMGENKVVQSGASLMIILTSPLYITHTVTN